MLMLKKDRKFLVEFTLNGKPARGFAEPRLLLTDFLRQEIGLTGIHVGCEHGVCGACTVLLDAAPARSCLIYAVQVHGRALETVEGLADETGDLDDLQQAFKRHHALQCGYCTPGVLMSVVAFLKTNPDPTETEVREMLSGHLCRCTGYTGMIRAVLDVAARRKADGSDAGS